MENHSTFELWLEKNSKHKKHTEKKPMEKYNRERFLKKSRSNKLEVREMKPRKFTSISI